MKFVFGIVLIATLAELSLATTILTQQDLPLFKKYDIREPPFDKNAKLADAVVETKWITQRLDHFDSLDARRWNMRYMQNIDYLQPGGPIFIYIGEFNKLIAGAFTRETSL